MGVAAVVILVVAGLCACTFAQFNTCDPNSNNRQQCETSGVSMNDCINNQTCCWYPIQGPNPNNLPSCFLQNAQNTPPTPSQCKPTAFQGNRYQKEIGTEFAVWAPHATQVWINGTFSNQPITSLMTLCDYNSNWAITVPSAVPGDEYNYIISYLHTNYSRIDPFSRIVTQDSSGKYQASVVHNPSFDWGDAANFVPPSHMNQVIYEMQISTFNPSSSDGVGTFDQVVDKLDYLQQLGVNVIEPIPVMEFPGDPRGWGYNPGAPFAVEYAFGGYDGLRNFVKECNLRGIAVYVDIVWNHMNGPPDNGLWQYDGWYEYEEGFPSGYGLPGGIYFYQDDNAETSWGPRPNFASETVRNYINHNVAMLMNECHVSGFRWDSTICIRKGGTACWEMPDDNDDGILALQQANTLIHSLGGFSIAEDLQNNATVNLPVSQGGLDFDAQWSDTSYYILQGVIGVQSDSQRSIASFIQVLEASYSNQPTGGEGGYWRVLYTENHDKASGQNQGQGRWPNIVDSSNPTSYIAQKLSLLGIATVMVSPAVPMIFYGQEFLDTENFVFGDVPNLPWSDVGNFANGQWSTIGPYNGVFNYTRDLISLRLNSNNVSLGLTSTDIDVYYSSQTDLTVAFTRGSSKDIVILMNLKSASYPEGYRIGVPYSGTWSIVMNSDLQQYSPIFGNVGFGQTYLKTSSSPLQGFPYQVNVPIGAYSTVILSYDQ